MGTHSARGLVLEAGDLSGWGLKLKRVYSDPKVMATLRPQGCVDECTSELIDRKDVQVRSSAEVYRDGGAATESLRGFIDVVARQHAPDHAAAGIGDESALFVTAILARRRRFMSDALCWRQADVIGKVTLVGPAERVEKPTIEILARSQSGKMSE